MSLNKVLFAYRQVWWCQLKVAALGHNMHRCINSKAPYAYSKELSTFFIQLRNGIDSFWGSKSAEGARQSAKRLSLPCGTRDE